LKRILSLLIVFILTSNGYSQQYSSKIEVKPYIRLDWYPEFSYNVGGRPSTDYLTIEGTSFGIVSNYKLPVSNKLNLIAGIGFYNYSFNKLENINSIFGKGHARVIDYPSPLDPIYTTDKYFYRTIFLNIGAERIFYLKNNTIFITGIELQNHYTISQGYHLASRNINFDTKEKRFFGHSILIMPSLLKRFQNFQIGPSLLIPVFDTWKKDKVFPGEIESENRNKWFRGIGLGISSNLLLTTKKT
jgi:hypothetical protein